MQRFIYKCSDRRDKVWRCCFCCHVRTGTIFLGVWHLILQVLLFSIVVVIVHNPELVQEWDEENILPTPLSEIDSPHGYFDHDWYESRHGLLGPRDHPRAMPSASHMSNSDLDLEFRQDSTGSRNQDVYGMFLKQLLYKEDKLPVAPQDTYHPLSSRDSLFLTTSKGQSRGNLNLIALVLLCSLAITLLMVYGAVQGKPSYLMPFFGMQVFDLSISSLTFLSYMYYLPNVHHLLAVNQHIPMRNTLAKLNPQVLSFFLLLTFTVALMVKVYFIGVVWRCYKYLALRMIASRRTIHFIDADNRIMAESLLGDLPDYETAVKKFPTPPPSYDLATASAPPPAEILNATATVPAPQSNQDASTSTPTTITIIPAASAVSTGAPQTTPNLIAPNHS